MICNKILNINHFRNINIVFHFYYRVRSYNNCDDGLSVFIKKKLNTIFKEKTSESM